MPYNETENMELIEKLRIKKKEHDDSSREIYEIIRQLDSISDREERMTDSNGKVMIDPKTKAIKLKKVKPVDPATGAMISDNRRIEVFNAQKLRSANYI